MRRCIKQGNNSALLRLIMDCVGFGLPRFAI